MLEPHDRLEIHELFARYNHAIDTGDAEAWAALFEEDGSFSGIVGDYQGRGELRAFAEAYATDPKYAEFREGQHWINNIVIDPITESKARVRTQQLMIRPMGETAVINFMGWYDDVVVKSSGEWRILTRKVNPVAAGANWMATSD